MMKIFESGGISNLKFPLMYEWREDLKRKLETEPNISVINHFQSFDLQGDYENMFYDLHKVRISDLVIVNFNDPVSIGTAMEISLAYELKKPIIGLNENDIEIHPWYKLMCSRIFKDREDLALYIISNYGKE